MIRFALLLSAASGLTLAMSAQGQSDPPIRVAIAGDSTARDYGDMSDSYQSLHGWGMFVQDYLADGAIDVLNHGKGGCSSKSFITEGRWEALLAEKPDFVLIQFGHNDIPNKGPQRETNPDAVPDTLPAEGPGSDLMDWTRHNFRTYIQSAREAGVTPIVVTPMERRAFTSNGKRVRPKNQPWADAAIAVAQELDAPVIDMNAFSIALLNDLGFEGCLFMHPTREGELDNTHYNEQGARIYAEFIARKLAELCPQINAANAEKTTGYVPLAEPK